MSEESRTGADEYKSGLIDVSAYTLDDLDNISESSLDVALARLLDAQDVGPVAGFSSAL
ncbi:hypothetical protein [Planobispora longispora]|nr:hypothetical protein [Planobispora longispora]